jgi:predicted ATPase
MIKINNNLKEESCFLYGPNNVLIGEIKNYFAFNDVRIQIREQKLSGYYIDFKNERIFINQHGKLDYWPKGLFDLFDKQLDKLLNL